MSTPEHQHNSLIAVREFLKIMLDEERYPDVPEKLRLSAKALLHDYPERSDIDKLYEGKTFSDLVVDNSDDITEQERVNNNRIYNNNQTWETPGYKWKTQVEFVPVKNS